MNAVARVGSMRIVGIVLVALGALILGNQGFGFWNPSRPTASARVAGWVPAVIGGIMLVSGLLVLATGPRRDQID